MNERGDNPACQIIAIGLVGYTIKEYLQELQDYLSIAFGGQKRKIRKKGINTVPFETFAQRIKYISHHAAYEKAR